VGQVVRNGVVVGHLPGEPILDRETWVSASTLPTGCPDGSVGGRSRSTTE
jgi:hypothetical protein